MSDERLFDLVRFMRNELHIADLITEEELALLSTDPRSRRSVKRLESYDELKQRQAALEAQNERLRKSLLNKHGDDLCWIINADQARALPETEFMESCRRYRNQIAHERGTLQVGQMTIAQLEQRIAELEGELEKARTK